jgi:predicted NUDIX family NTP pyrophosphohydrolase
VEVTVPARLSAGLLLHRPGPRGPQVLIGHPGGPLWATRDTGAWSVPKGEVEPGEDPYAAARREFTEELGLPVPDGPPVDLGRIRQSGGKVVQVWAVAADLDLTGFHPGTFTMAWPPRSGRLREYPELDRVEWCDRPEAARRLVRGQVAFLDRLAELARRDGPDRLSEPGPG